MYENYYVIYDSGYYLYVLESIINVSSMFFGKNLELEYI